MKRIEVTRRYWFFAAISFMILALTSSVLAEEIGSAEGEVLIINEGIILTKPEGPGDTVDDPNDPQTFLSPSPDPELMSWTTMLNANFDGSSPLAGWSFNNYHPTKSYYWGTDTYRSFSTSRSVHPGGGGADGYDPRAAYYDNNMNSWMTYGPFNFNSATDARIEFNLWMDTEISGDWFHVCASTDNSSYYCLGYSGATEGWEAVSHGFSDWSSAGSLVGEPMVWIGFVFVSNTANTGPGVFIDDVLVTRTASTLEPDLKLMRYDTQPNLYHPGDSFASESLVKNVGGLNCVNYTFRDYISTDSTITSSDIEISYNYYIIPTLAPDDERLIYSNPTIPGPTPPGIYFLGAMISCLNDTNTSNDVYLYPNPIQVAAAGLDGIIFQDNFESHDLTSWTRFNPGNTGLSACAAGAFNGVHGACFYRPAGNDKRRQLIDETPVSQTSFDVRFSFDINGLSMLEGERFRFMQVKMGAERPYFIVLKFQSGKYWIQLNTLQDDLSKVKTGWYLLSDAPHTIEIDWQAATAPGANNGLIGLILDDSLVEAFTTLDNDTIYVDSFKIGYTSRLAGKSISGTFYVDDVITSNAGSIGPP